MVLGLLPTGAFFSQIFFVWFFLLFFGQLTCPAGQSRMAPASKTPAEGHTAPTPRTNTKEGLPTPDRMTEGDTGDGEVGEEGEEAISFM
jgi:hypothetical protein